jgi:chromosome segregation ATPase
MEEVNAIKATVRRIEDHQASMDRDLETDRRNLQDLSVAVQQLVAEVGELRKRVGLIPNQVRDKVAEVNGPIIESNEELKNAVDKAKKKDIIFVKEGKSWLQKIIGRK